MMDGCGFKFIFMLLLLSGITITSAELLRPPQPPQHNYAFNKFRPPPPPEPTFIQRITNWFFPWGGVTSEEEYQFQASPKIDSQTPPRPPQYPHVSASRINPMQVRDTEPTTARTTQHPPVTKCSPCNKVPWIPMMPTHQLPLVKPGGQEQVYFKHHFGNENQYVQVPSGNTGGYIYHPPSSTQPPSTTPIKFQDGNFLQAQQQYYGAPPIRNVQFQGYQYTQSPLFPRTTFRPNTNTIDTSIITFTTGRPQNNRPLRFTAAGSVTNPEYILPPNVLPLEGENGQFVPIPIPNLSPSPIPPLFDAKPFRDDHRNQNTGFIQLVPLEPVAQLSNNVNVQVKPDASLPRFEAINEGPAIEIINSNLVAEFSLPPETVHSDYTTKASKANGLKFNLDLGNNLDINPSSNAVFGGDRLETATDTISAGSEHGYLHNVQQPIDTSITNFNDSDDDTIDVDESNRFVPLFNTYDQDLGEASTTEGNYVVKFEPSLQTAADLADKALKKNKSEALKKNRPTPLELLDSPALHAKPLKSTPFTEAPPPAFKPLEDFTKTLATLWTSPPPFSSSTDATPTPTYEVPQTTTQATVANTLPPAPTTTLSFLSKISGGEFSGITPPRAPTPSKPSPSTKKPKQIQIVIPYTTFHKPSPFKVQDQQELITYRPIRGHYVTHPTKGTEIKNLKEEENFNGHGYHNDQEYPDHAQESKIVESKISTEAPKTTKYFTKILANNIRDLLKKERTPKPQRIDLIRLQKNIDGWTEQSYSGKASTISLTGHTKAIPKSFFTSTIKPTTFTKVSTTTLSPKTTFDPELMEETKRQYDNILYKKDDESLYVKRHDRFLDRDNELVLLNNNLTYSSAHEGVKVFAPKTTLTPKELWKRLHITISPLTNEKIYVVTPQPSQDVLTLKTSTFKPRFAVRPTVAGKQNI